MVRKKRETLEQAYPALREKIDNSHFDTLILSSEGFGERAMKQKKIRWLKDQFPDFEIRVIAYIRPQDSYFLSIYQEGVKGGRTSPFEFEDYQVAKDLYFGRRLNPWRAEFGPENVIVRPFAPQMWPERELFFDFLDIIDANREGLAVLPPENEGLDYRAVEFMRQLNHVEKEQPASRGTRPVRNRKLAAAFDQILSDEAGKQKMSFSTEQVEILRRHFREDNAVALEGSGLGVDQFFPPAREGSIARLVPKTLDPHQLVRLIAQRQLSGPTKGDHPSSNSVAKE